MSHYAPHPLAGGYFAKICDICKRHEPDAPIGRVLVTADQDRLFVAVLDTETSPDGFPMVLATSTDLSTLFKLVHNSLDRRGVIA